MGAIGCRYYQLRADEQYALEITRDLQVFGGFEPAEPLLPVEKEKYSDRLQDIDEQIREYELVVDSVENLLTTEQKKQHRGVLQLDTKNMHKLLTRKDVIDQEVDKCLELYRQQELLQQQIEVLRLELENVEPYREINERVFQTFELMEVKLFSVSINADLQDLKKLEGVHYQKLAQKQEKILGVCVYLRAQSEPVEAMLQRAGASMYQPAETLGEVTPRGIANALEKEIQKLEKEHIFLQRKFVQIGEKRLREFKAISDILAWEKQSLDSLNKVGYAYNERLMTKRQIQIEGWMNPKYFDVLKKRLHAITKSADLAMIEREEQYGERRVVLKNPSFVRPFEAVTTLMGVPDPEEIDPTPFVMPFFILFFGFALGDAGYGLLMTVVCLSLLLFTRLQSQMIRDAVMLILYCGLSTTLFGALTGGWFGIDLTEAEGGAADFLRSISVLGETEEGEFRTLQDMLMFFLVASLSVGFLHQILGLILKFVAYAKNGRWIQGFYDPGSWILFWAAFVYLIATQSVEALEGQGVVAWIFFTISVAFFAWGQGYGTRNAFLRPLTGIVGLLNITSYLSNTLSYSRLLALGLATGVIGSVVNIIGLMVFDAIPFTPLAILIAAVVLVLGHTVNLGLNLLGSLINVARLQLVEFFPRFFDAQGIALNPLEVETKYTRISPQVTGKFA